MARVTKKKASFGTTMGVSSIIAILVILVLVVFSALSITTSKADLKLSQKTSAGVIAYYEADATAVDMMAEVADVIKDGPGWQSKLPDAYDITTGEDATLITYTVPVDNNRNLNVRLSLNGDGKLYRELWQVVPAREWVPDNNLNLFMPEK
jgi:hypothetical protein